MSESRGAVKAHLHVEREKTQMLFDTAKSEAENSEREEVQNFGF